VAPAQRSILQALGRLIRSENDRGIGIVLDHRAPQFSAALPGLAPLPELGPIVRSFFGRRPNRPAAPAAGSVGPHNP
jgi:hypothetical protein